MAHLTCTSRHIGALVGKGKGQEGCSRMMPSHPLLYEAQGSPVGVCLSVFGCSVHPHY